MSVGTVASIAFITFVIGVLCGFFVCAILSMSAVAAREEEHFQILRKLEEKLKTAQEQNQFIKTVTGVKCPEI